VPRRTGRQSRKMHGASGGRRRQDQGRWAEEATAAGAEEDGERLRGVASGHVESPLAGSVQPAPATMASRSPSTRQSACLGSLHPLWHRADRRKGRRN
jgi:hypothetical protein